MGRDYYPDGALTAENSHPAGVPSGNPPAISAWLVDYRGDNALTFFGDGVRCDTEFFQVSLRDNERRMLTDYRAEKAAPCDCGANVCSWIEKYQKDYVRMGPWAMVTYDRTDGTAFWALDHLGSPRKRVNRFGTSLTTAILDSSGKELSPLTGERHRFTGHERNHVSVLDGSAFPISDFMHARTFIPMLGRFTRPDPADSVSPLDPQSLNRYTYARNNPLKYVDPDGKAPLEASDYSFIAKETVARTADQIAYSTVRPLANAIWNSDDPRVVVGGIGEHLLFSALGGFGRIASLGGGASGSVLGLEAVGSLGGELGLTTKVAARAALGSLGVEGEQLAAASRTISRATASSTIDVTRGTGGTVIVSITRQGRNGSQVMRTVVNADGTKTVVQMAFDAEGKLVHYHPKAGVAQ